ncbi:manganese efflux pump [Bacillus sp. GM2]|uniref:manganese efflux pump n=1 Tax=Bacillus sp. GM2 TaxID=3373599 RepID=UPI003F91613D
MTSWIIIAGLTVSSSVDNLGVGLSYGIRQIRISFFSNVVISLICFLFSVCGIHFGLWISTVLPGILPVLAGSVLLAVIGLRIMLLAVPRRKPSPLKENGSTGSPLQTVGFFESILLGIALSANALTNGVGAGLFAYSPLLISVLAAAGSFLTVWAGAACGSKLAHIHFGHFTVGQFGTLISGAILLLIAGFAFFY